MSSKFFLGLLLFRGIDRNIDQRNLGEILLDKANRGVKVYVMVWSEKTSGDILGEKVGNIWQPILNGLIPKLAII